MLGLRDVAIGCCLGAALALAGCGGGRGATTPAGEGAPSGTAGDAAPQPVPAGHGPAFRLPPHGERALRRLPIDGAACRRHAGRRVRAHLELFARGLVVPIPAGIGIAPPLRRRGAYVLGGGCSYVVRTTEPTGLLELRADARISLRELFDVWGQPLSRGRVATFRGSAARPVRAYVGGVRWRGDPRAIPVRRHAVIVLEVGPYVPPHTRYVFPPGG